MARICLVVDFLLVAGAANAAPFAYITNDGNNTVSVINTATNAVTATVAVGVSPFGVAVHPDGSRVYVTNYGSSSVSVINTATNTVTATVAVGSYPSGLAVHPDGSRVYVGNQSSCSVSVIDTATNTVTATVAGVLGCPNSVAVHPDGSRVYVANTGSDSVSVIDTATNTVTATVPGLSGPVAFGNFIGPLSPMAQIDRLITKIKSLASAGRLNQQQANTLTTLLKQASDKLAAGKNKTAVVSQLQAFINNVERLMKAGVIVAEGPALIDSANKIIVAVSK